jgi:hypothetical protein
MIESDLENHIELANTEEDFIYKIRCEVLMLVINSPICRPDSIWKTVIIF